MKRYIEDQKYLRAKRKVDNLRAFYIHIVAYIIVNIFITVIKITKNLENGETLNEAVFDFATVALWLTWGVALAFHTFYIFGFDYFLGKNWEEKRLQEFIDDEEDYLKDL